KVTQDPAAAVEEHEHRQAVAPGARGPHDVKLQRLATVVDRPVRLLDARQVDPHALLRIDQNLARVSGRELLDRRAAARVQGLEELPYAADDEGVHGRGWHVPLPSTSVGRDVAGSA